MKKSKLSFFIAFLYVAAGTIYGLYLSAFPGSIQETVALLLFWLLAPVCFMVIILSSGNSTHYELIALVQICTLLIIWLFAWLLIGLIGRLRRQKGKSQLNTELNAQVSPEVSGLK